MLQLTQATFQVVMCKLSCYIQPLSAVFAVSEFESNSMLNDILQYKAFLETVNYAFVPQ